MMQFISQISPSQVIPYPHLIHEHAYKFQWPQNDKRYKNCFTIFENLKELEHLNDITENLTPETQILLKLFQNHLNDIFKYSQSKKLNRKYIAKYYNKIEDEEIRHLVMNILDSPSLQNEIRYLSKNIPDEFTLFYVEPMMFLHKSLDGYIFKMPNKESYNPVYPLSEKYHLNENIGRIIMAQRMRRVIKSAKLNHLYVPKKRLYKYKSNSGYNDHNCVVIVKKLDLGDYDDTGNFLDSLSTNDLSIKLDQLFHLIYKTGFQGAHGGNIMYVRSGKHKNKLAIIDTEPKGNIELSHRHGKLSHTFGIVRNKELICAEFGIQKAKEKLQFPKEIRKKITDKYLRMMKAEKISNQMKLIAIIALSAILICGTLFLTRQLKNKNPFGAI